MTMSKYRVFPDDEFDLLRIIHEDQIPGFMWPHSAPCYFDLWLTEEDLLALTLKTRIKSHAWLQDEDEKFPICHM